MVRSKSAWTIFARSGITALLIAPLLFGATTRADQLDDAVATYEAKRYPEAIKLLVPLAEAGDAEAQFLLGRMTDKGQGTHLNHKNAADWYKRAADHGHVRSQIALGDMLSDDSIVFRDYGSAMEYYRRAADNGSADGAFKVSGLYGSGKGVLTNDAEAFRWAKLAAERGSAEGTEVVGLSYASGKGTDKNSFEAYVWLTIAARRYWSSGRTSGAKLAIWSRDTVSRELSSKQITEAAAIAEQKLKLLPAH